MRIQATVKPNSMQRAFHRILMMRPATFILARILHRVDLFVWKLNGGRYSLTSALAGLPTFMVTTTGAKSRLPRNIPLVGLSDGERIILIASNFGQAHHPSWYHNLKANPECEVRLNGTEKVFIARETEGAERDQFWHLAVSYYRGYEVYRKRAGRRIPVMVLEPRKWLPDS
jgi:deazaflavin-dependent oxidoreductase (nitroreductase family)